MPTVTTSSSAADSARINLRTSPEVKALIERAATLMGTTVSSYISQTMYEKSQRLLADAEKLMRTPQTAQALTSACDAVTAPAQVKRVRASHVKR